MGAWGTSIFSDDLSCDIRDEYKQLLSEGISDEKVVKKMLKKYHFHEDELEDYTVFWLSFAATQWNLGRLDEIVRTKAIEIIDNESNLKLWEAEDIKKSDYNKRKKELQKLREKLISEQPKRKMIKKIEKVYTEFNKGEVYSYQLKSQKYIIFKVVDVHEDLSGSHAVIEILDWIGNAILDLDEIEKLKPKLNKFEEESHISIYETKRFKVPKDRMQLLMKTPKKKNNFKGGPVWHWKEFDEELSDYYNLN